MTTRKKTTNADAELIDVLTSISTVAMRLAVKLEMLTGRKGGTTACADRNKHNGGMRHETV